MLDPARRDKMLVEVGGELVHRFGLLFGRNSESVIRLRPVLVPQVGEFLTEPIPIEPGLGTSLIESPVTTDDLLGCHRPVVNEPELDGTFDSDKRRLDHDRVVAPLEEVRPSRGEPARTTKLNQFWVVDIESVFDRYG